MEKIDLAGQVALVTGAGSGLGREYALELARRGAKVVVNDLGTSLKGEGRSSEAALQVVKEIEALGGEAIANFGSVSSMADMEAAAKDAIDRFGRIDILVANAGILRDSSFRKASIDEFELVIDVHLLGTVRAVKAVWNAMCDAGYGRIILTTSTAGLFGNFGQSNYGAAKMGIVGFMNTLKQEGHKYDVRVNCISPIAATRMSEEHIPAEMLDMMHPRYVAAAVAFLASRAAPNGAILNAGAGFLSVSCMTESAGKVLPLDETTAENIAAAWPQLAGQSDFRPYASALEHAQSMMGRVASGR
jgi:NAD(P)-dependent dehydrogenase (short-subunit alcohol dehydrogenase family)